MNVIIIVVLIVGLVLATAIVVAHIANGFAKDKFELLARSLDTEFKMQVWAAQHPEEVLPVVSLGDNAPEELKQYIPVPEEGEMLDAAAAIMHEIHDIMNAEEDVVDERAEE